MSLAETKPKVMRELKDNKGNVIQTQEEAHDAQAKGKTTKHAEEETVVAAETASSSTSESVTTTTTQAQESSSAV
jgi:hypothetical protein